MAYAQNADEPAGGVRPLNEESHEDAIACGRVGFDCAVRPYQLCPSADGPYSATLITPYSRVASYVFQGLNMGHRLRIPEPGVANKWGVAVYVLPTQNVEKADSIQKVWVRRAGRTVPPTTTTLAPVTVPASGAQLSKGFFAFPINTFEPGPDVTFVFLGSNGETTCRLDSRTLAALR